MRITYAHDKQRIKTLHPRIVLEWDETHNCHSRESGHPGVPIKKLDSRLRGNDMGKLFRSQSNQNCSGRRMNIAETLGGSGLAISSLAGRWRRRCCASNIDEGSRRARSTSLDWTCLHGSKLLTVTTSPRIGHGSS